MRCTGINVCSLRSGQDAIEALTQQERQHPLIGRKTELQHFMKEFEHFKNQRSSPTGSLVVIKGDGGVGKTRMLDAAIVASSKSDCKSVYLRYLNFAKNQSHFVYLDILFILIYIYIYILLYNFFNFSYFCIQLCPVIICLVLTRIDYNTVSFCHQGKTSTMAIVAHQGSLLHQYQLFSTPGTSLSNILLTSANEIAHVVWLTPSHVMACNSHMQCSGGRTNI